MLVVGIKKRITLDPLQHGETDHGPGGAVSTVGHGPVRVCPRAHTIPSGPRPPPAIPRTTRSTIHYELKQKKKVIVITKILSSSVRACAPTPLQHRALLPPPSSHRWARRRGDCRLALLLLGPCPVATGAHTHARKHTHTHPAARTLTSYLLVLSLSRKYIIYPPIINDKRKCALKAVPSVRPSVHEPFFSKNQP